MDLDFSLVIPYLPLLVNGIILTIKFTVWSTIFGFTWGVLLSLIKISSFKPLALLGQFYTSFFRGTPLLVQLMLIYFATPQLVGYDISSLEAGVLAFGLNSAAYISESIRGGILSVDKGQREAAMALGVSEFRIMKDIILPQAFKNILPSLVNESIALLKDSSMVAIIGVGDTLRWAQQVQAKTFRAFEAFIVVALIYYVMVMVLTAIGSYLERRARVSD
ncbi:amino acid ABC transporter permease [Desulforamulus aeronauticus]|uniref:Polar amino acid transport system permease protein n=1 Tax=Desulforamulus aeronauticus DSM 10349 TaxID=1121421 RepID=A0A1M6TV60_9FIRM|nr:amino acid ABC transporter permease [Desulforamulus aeronauticus]SHK60816.1 polar amino acid transport system permease protein [Desulforamulus aeronauticus DSM 10349]